MTRNYEIDCRDLVECQHEPETPICQDGEIIGWLCRCGRQVPLRASEQKATALAAERKGKGP